MKERAEFRRRGEGLVAGGGGYSATMASIMAAAAAMVVVVVVVCVCVCVCVIVGGMLGRTFSKKSFKNRCFLHASLCDLFCQAARYSTELNGSGWFEHDQADHGD